MTGTFRDRSSQEPCRTGPADGGSADAPGRRRPWSRIAAGLALGVWMLGSVPAGAEEYNPKEAGHPLRIVGYVLHPVGVTLDYLILRPAFWIGSHEPFKTMFGRTD